MGAQHLVVSFSAAKVPDGQGADSQELVTESQFILGLAQHLVPSLFAWKDVICGQTWQEPK